MLRWSALVLLLVTGPVWGFDQSHQQWSQLLGQAVHWNGTHTESAVDYDYFLAHQRELDTYLSSLSEVNRQTFDSWSDALQLAFLINAYNAFTIKLILSRYPGLDSIKELGGLFRSAWKQEFFTLFGEEHHLDYIEHEMIRPRYRDPRIHFALNCAARSCPPLLPEAFTEDNLERLFEQNINRFLGNRNLNSYDPGSRTLFISKLFDWYGEDFKVAPYGSVTGFLQRHAGALGDNESMQRRLQQGKQRFGYMPYDWSLNRWPFPE